MSVCWCVLTAECLSYLSSLGGIEIFQQLSYLQSSHASREAGRSNVDFQQTPKNDVADNPIWTQTVQIAMSGSHKNKSRQKFKLFKSRKESMRVHEIELEAKRY